MHARSALTTCRLRLCTSTVDHISNCFLWSVDFIYYSFPSSIPFQLCFKLARKVMLADQIITRAIGSTTWITRETIVHYISFASIVTCVFFYCIFSKQCLVGKSEGLTSARMKNQNVKETTTLENNIK